MPVLRYRCPVTGKLTEVWTELEDFEGKEDGFLDTVHCQACGAVHLVDSRTAHVAGEDA
jgi:uncharacterized Zn finger protein